MRGLLLLTGILVAAMPLSGSESLKISISPAQSVAPANLFIRVSIEPNAENRMVVVAAESEDYYRSSEVVLEGDQGPKTVVVQFRSVPGGHYEIRSAVGDAKGRELATARQNIYVMGQGLDR